MTVQARWRAIPDTSMTTDEMTREDFELALKLTMQDYPCYELYFGAIVPCGSLKTSKRIRDSVVVDGLEYHRDDIFDAVINYESGEAGTAKMYYHNGKKIIEEDYPLTCLVVGLAPFGKIDVFYDSEHSLPYETFLGLERCPYTSKTEADAYYGAARMVLGDVYHYNYHKSLPDQASKVKFYHLYYSWGYGNSLYIPYRYDDLLNMNVADQESKDVEELRGEAEHDPLIKDSLNFSVFERPLTDVEKLECTKKFINLYSKELKKHATGKH